MTKDAAIKLLREACEAAQRNHGVSLLSMPPQDVWLYYRVGDQLATALRATAHIEQGEAEPDAYMTQLSSGEIMSVYFQRVNAEASLNNWPRSGEIIPLYRHPAPVEAQPVATKTREAEQRAKLDARLAGRCGTADVDELFGAPNDTPPPAAEGERDKARDAERIKVLEKALRFYADGEHFTLHDSTAWDTVSGEPQNFYEDESNTATVEDGSVAGMALAGTPLPDDDSSAPAQQSDALSDSELLGMAAEAGIFGTIPQALSYGRAIIARISGKGA